MAVHEKVQSVVEALKVIKTVKLPLGDVVDYLPELVVRLRQDQYRLELDCGRDGLLYVTVAK